MILEFDPNNDFVHVLPWFRIPKAIQEFTISIPNNFFLQILLSTLERYGFKWVAGGEAPTKLYLHYDRDHVEGIIVDWRTMRISWTFDLKDRHLPPIISIWRLVV